MQKVDFIRKEIFLKSLAMSSFLLFVPLSFIAAIMFVITPLVLNNIVREQNAITAFNIFLIVLFLVVGHLVLAANIFIKNKLIQKYHVDATLAMYKNVFKISYDSYLKMEPSNIQQRVYSAVDAYSRFFFGTVPTLIINSVMIVTTLLIIVFMNPMIALLMFLTLPFNYFGYKYLNKKLSKLSVELNETSSKAWKDENSVISQVDFIKQNANNDYLLPLIGKHKNLSQDITRRVNNYANGASSMLSGVNLIVKNLLILLLASMMLQDAYLVGSVLFVILVLPYFTTAVAELTRTNLDISAIKAADVFIEEITNAFEVDGKQPLQKIDDIFVSIPEVSIGGNVLLRDVSMQFKKGDIIGIIGGSGMGKSTLVKLIAKFRPSQSIQVNGVVISDLQNKDYLTRVSYYSQQAPIISGTILENLNFGRKPSSEDTYKVIEFLNKFENLQEIILENGSNLSGGDKQRIAMARYFTEEADIVILDEPTNSLDKATEDEILSSVLRHNDDKIIFLISHNPKNMKYCTHITEIHEGKLVNTN